MNTTPVVLVEDDPDDQQIFLEYTSQVPFLTVTGVFANPLEATRFIQTNPVDLLFLDIGLPHLSGLEMIQSLSAPPPIILTTLDLNRSLEAYDVGVVDYLVKPFSFARFMRAVNRALSRQPDRPPAVVFLKDGHDTIRVLLDELLYVEAYGQLCKLHLSDQVRVVSHSITELQDLLPSARFLRVHRSFLVSIARIDRFSARSLFLGAREIPVGSAYQIDLKRLTEGR